jgi:hypothetical protein
VLLPSLVVNVLNSDPWYLLAGKLYDAHLSQTQLEEAWETHWPEVWDLARPILHQMLRNLRHAEEYLDLLPGVRESLSEALLNRLIAGKYELTEVQLHKNSYKQAWLVQEWFPNKDVDDFQYTLPGWVFTGPPAGPSTPRRLDKWHLAFVAADIAHELERLLYTIVGSMGAEAVSQTQNLIWRQRVIQGLLQEQRSGPGYRAHDIAAGHCKFHTDADCDRSIQAWEDVALQVGALLPIGDLCFVCEKPTRQAFNELPTVSGADSNIDLHNSEGPALAYSDGFKIYAWHGVFVPGDVIEFPDAITCQRIESEVNAEVRRVMIERYGASRYLEDSGAQLVHCDDFGSLYRKELPNDEPLVMVKVVNSTPEPDGSYKDYFLRVPPDITTAREAVAWTFHLTEDDYQPDRQT